MTDSPLVSLRTTVLAVGKNTGIEIPPELIERLGAGQRPAVIVELNGYRYQNTVGVMGGKHLVSVSAAVRKATGLAGGDPVDVTLRLATEPRAVELHDEFRDALEADPRAGAFFAGLSNSLQRYHADRVNDAKTDATRQRRIAKAMELFRAEKQR